LSQWHLRPSLYFLLESIIVIHRETLRKSFNKFLFYFQTKGTSSYDILRTVHGIVTGRLHSRRCYTANCIAFMAYHEQSQQSSAGDVLIPNVVSTQRW
jgi:predicted phosphoadenosine phosphosulfate sulfurtransferase